MKPLIYHLVVGVLLLCSCDNSTHEELFLEKVPVPVRLAIEENVLSTRAMVTAIDGTNVTNVGIYGVREGSTAEQFPWTTSPYVSNLAPTAITGSQLTFASKLYYPMGGKRVKFYAYYPRTTATSGANYITPPGSGTAPIYNFTITGQEDIMYASSTSSGSGNPATVAFTFNHALTQLKLSTALLLGTLSSIKLVGIHNQGTLNIETGVVTFSSTTVDLPLTAGLLGAINPVMVQANVASYKVQATLSLLGIGLVTNTYLIKPTSGNFLPGIIYSISL